jgi:hypothetical protein
MEVTAVAAVVVASLGAPGSWSSKARGRRRQRQAGAEGEKLTQWRSGEREGRRGAPVSDLPALCLFCPCLLFLLASLRLPVASLPFGDVSSRDETHGHMLVTTKPSPLGSVSTPCSEARLPSFAPRESVLFSERQAQGARERGRVPTESAWAAEGGSLKDRPNLAPPSGLASVPPRKAAQHERFEQNTGKCMRAATVADHGPSHLRIAGLSPRLAPLPSSRLLPRAPSAGFLPAHHSPLHY